jgi:transcriptional regulator with XRE-family HTH domain
MMPKRIREKRLELGMTQEELASKLGLQKSAIAKYESGRVTNIKRSTIQKMSEIFGCSPAWLMGLDDNASERDIEIAIRSEGGSAHWKKYLGLSQSKRKIVDDLIDELYGLRPDD